MADVSAQVLKEQRLRTLPDTIGVYALCDLDETPIYVGRSVDGIRARVRRHLTSARSDVIANRQIDVWEIAYVWAWPLAEASQVAPLEARIIGELNSRSPLVNAEVEVERTSLPFAPPKTVRVKVMSDELIRARQDPTLRFPRQIQHFNQLVDYILNTQDKPHLRRALQVYFDRLSKYYHHFLLGAGRAVSSDT